MSPWSDIKIIFDTEKTSKASCQSATDVKKYPIERIKSKYKKTKYEKSITKSYDWWLSLRRSFKWILSSRSVISWRSQTRYLVDQEHHLVSIIDKTFHSFPANSFRIIYFGRSSGSKWTNSGSSILLESR